jgi:diacylglycerol kinase (ATP)
MNILGIRNPASGQKEDGFDAFCAALRDRGGQFTVRQLEKDGPSLEALLKDARSFDRIVAAGGDGTISAVAHALRGSDLPIMIYPGGTGNLLALNLDLPKNPRALAELTLGGRTLKADLAELHFDAAPGENAPEPIGFSLNAGTGFDAKLIEGSEPLKDRLGLGAYLASALSNANPTVAKFTLEMDGETILTEGIGVMVVNHGRMQLGIELAPDADASDGLLDVLVLRAQSLAGLIPAVVGSLLENIGLRGPSLDGCLELYQAKRVRVSSDPPQPVQFDGETIDRMTPFEASVLPNAASFVVPEGSKLEPV